MATKAPVPPAPAPAAASAPPAGGANAPAPDDSDDSGSDTGPDDSDQGDQGQDQGGDSGGDDPDSGDSGGQQPNPDGSVPNVTPQMQQEFEQVMDAAFKLIYGKTTLAAVLTSLKAGNAPVMSLARTTITIVIRLQDAFEQNKQPIDDPVLFGAGKAILEDLATLSLKAKLHNFSQHEIDVAYYNAMDMYRAIAVQKGWIDPKEFQQEMQQIKEADQDGTLDNVLPGMQQVVDKVAQNPQQYAGAQHSATGGNPEPGSPADQATRKGGAPPPAAPNGPGASPPQGPAFTGMQGGA